MANSFIYLEQVDSTNEWIKRNLSTLPPAPIQVVIAKEQTMGKGRGGKFFFSPPQGLYISYLFFFSKDQPTENIAQVAALALVSCLRRFSLHANIKWPNDVMVNYKKIGGILCETITRPNGTKAIILGIGLNANTPQSLLTQVDQATTSIVEEKKQPVLLFQLAEWLTQEVQTQIAIYQQQGFASFHSQINSFLLYLGQPVQITTDEESVEGTVLSLSPQGWLNVALSNSVIRSFCTGSLRAIKG